MTPQEAKAIMDSGADYVLVDVRSPQEYSTGHIRGARSLPVETIQQAASVQLKDKGATILLYCASGSRSSQAARILAALGYTDVHDFGGLYKWPYGMIE